MKKIQTSNTLSVATLLSVALLAASCQRSEVNDLGLQNPIEARDGSFAIVGNLGDFTLRAHDNVWEAEDAIGVFAFEKGTVTPFGGFSNVKYTTVDASGVFKAANGGITVSGDDAADIVAYYPFDAALQGNNYAVNVASQSSLKDIDLIWGKGTTSASVQTAAVPVSFSHQLALVQIAFTQKEGYEMPAANSVTLKGMTTTASFDVVSGQITKGSETADLQPVLKDNSGTLILIPGQELKTFDFTFDGKPVTYNLDQAVTLESGKKYTFTFHPYVEEESIVVEIDAKENGSLTDWNSGTNLDQDIVIPTGEVTPSEDDDDPTQGGGTTEDEKDIPVLFSGSDFEDWNAFLSQLTEHGLKDAQQAAGEGRDGSQALKISTTPQGNDYVFTAILDKKLDKVPSKISFWIKGTAGKALSMNVYLNGGTEYEPFNLDSDPVMDDSRSEVVLSAADANSYANSGIDTKDAWIKVSLDLSTISKGTVNTGVGEQILAIKCGKSQPYDLLIDDITFE